MDDAEFSDLFSENELSDVTVGHRRGEDNSYTDVFDDLFGELDCHTDIAPTRATLGHSTGREPLATLTPLVPISDSTSEYRATEKIEAIFAQLHLDLQASGKDLEISLQTRPRAGSLGASSDRLISCHKIKFPGKRPQEAWRFTMVVRILQLMYEAMRTGVVVSKRDIFYRDPALFVSQRRVDKYVDDIAFTLGTSRTALNVTAAAKGLVAGAVRFCRRDGSQIDAANDREGLLVPPAHDLLSADLSSVDWILVIEKEATFRSIAASTTFWETVATRGVILTGKGYPDLASRALLHFLSTASPRNGFASPPVYGLVDFDPDGLAILSVYRHGSAALAHESAHLAVPTIQWLGLDAVHVQAASQGAHAIQGVMSLTGRDRAKARQMLRRGGDDTMIQALQTMLMLNIKAEMQLLDATPGSGMLQVLSQLP